MLILFCEECGEKIEIQDTDGCDGRVRKCAVCGESLIILDQQECSGQKTLAAAALEQHHESRNNNRRIKVLIVDDSAFFRRVFKQILANAPQIEIVGEAANGAEALEMVKETDPDVVTMDINMPVMDGIKALKHLMIKSPRPTVMFSTLTTEGAHETFDALRYGAIDFIPKPSRLFKDEIETQQNAIVRKIKLAANVAIERIRLVRTGTPDPCSRDNGVRDAASVIILGAAEGGYSSFLKIAPQLHPGLPSALIGVLYADQKHVDSFAAYLDGLSQIRVKRAKNGETLQGNTLYFVCGTEYATVEKHAEKLIFVVHPAPFPNRKGSVDMVMFSLAELMGAKAMGVVLSGSGRDGAEGIQEIHRLGGTPVVQAPTTCLVKEMPMAAIGRCAASRVVGDAQIAAEINAKFVIT
jgi:two-component system chemotaxis response regulator CheB